MLEDVGGVPAQQVEFGTMGKKGEAGGGEIASRLARQQLVQPVAKLVKRGDIGRRVGGRLEIHALQSRLVSRSKQRSVNDLARFRARTTSRSPY